MTDHQKLLLEMLRDFDAVCAQHNIQYQLFAGTALGAVRHQGFIPWDDDIDVILLRSEYERFFREAAADFNPDIYYVQEENSEHWPMQFSKLRRNNTTCIEKYHPKDPLVHQGVYIDIFPCDNLSDNQIKDKIQFAASKVVIAKALYERGYETDSVAKKIFMQLCRIISREKVERLCMQMEGSKTKRLHTFLAAGKQYGKNVLPRKWLENSIVVPFENGKFPISAYYDELLTQLYGDWHQVPSEDERKRKEHVAILDLEHDYTNYLDDQKKMHIAQYTRSIR